CSCMANSLISYAPRAVFRLLLTEPVSHDLLCPRALRCRGCACNHFRAASGTTAVIGCDDDPGFEPGIHRWFRRECRSSSDKLDIRCWREPATVGRQCLPVAAQRSPSSRWRCRRHLWSTKGLDYRCDPVRVVIRGMRNGAKRRNPVDGALGSRRERRFIDAEQSRDFGNGVLRRGKGPRDWSLGSRRRCCRGDWPGTRWLAYRLRIVASDLPDQCAYSDPRYLVRP